MNQEILNLNEDKLIGIGSERKCYIHPHDKGKCIKITYKFGRRTKARGRREIKYSLKYSNLPDHLPSIPQYFGKVNTNLGIGHVFELILDYDGNISSKLSEFIKANEPNKSLTDKISGLYQSFLQSRVIVSDLHPGNLVLQKSSADNYQLVMIDGFGNSDFIKICDYSRFFLKKKLMRKFTRMLAQLGLPNEGIF